MTFHPNFQHVTIITIHKPIKPQPISILINITWPTQLIYIVILIITLAHQPMLIIQP